MAISLVGEVADAWFQLLSARQRQAVLLSQLEVSEDYLELGRPEAWVQVERR